MCLITKNKLEIQTAETDIPVYKVLYRADRKTFYPPLLNDGSPYRKGEERNSELSEMKPVKIFNRGRNVSTDGSMVVFFGEDVYEWVSSLGLYSVKNKDVAQNFKKTVRLCQQGKLKTYHCTIPKGARYITDGYTYISDRLVVNRMCLIPSCRKFLQSFRLKFRIRIRSIFR